MSRSKKIMCYTLAGIAIAALCFVAVEHLRGAVALHRHLDRLRANGEKLVVSELAPAPVAEEQNAAVLLSKLDSNLRNAPAVKAHWPPLGNMTAPGRTIRVLALERWPVEKRDGSEPELNSIGWGEFSKEVTEQRQLVEEIRAAAALPGFNSGIKYDAGLADLHTTQLLTIKLAAQLLSADALVALREQRLEAAIADLKAIRQLCGHFENEPLMISQLVRSACDRIAANLTWETLQHGGWSDAAFIELQACWQPQDQFSASLRSLEMERAMSIAYFIRLKASRTERRKVVDQWTKITELADEKRMLPTAGWWLEWFHLPLWRVAWADQDELRSLKRWQVVIEAAQKTKGNSWKDAEEASLGAEWPLLDSLFGGSSLGLYDRWRFVFSADEGGVSPVFIRRALEADTHQNLVRTAIALTHFRSRHGAWPQSLDAVIPEFLAAVPVDRMDGQPLRYRAGTNDTFVLYSVGYDGRDDGGDPTVSGGSIQMWKGRDAVWPMPASAEEIQRAQTGPAKLK